VRDDTYTMVQTLQKDAMSPTGQAERKAVERCLHQTESWMCRFGALTTLVGSMI
ncbi:Hypothetical predicted protein, partial [Pelobates cultripes]